MPVAITFGSALTDLATRLDTAATIHQHLMVIIDQPTVITTNHIMDIIEPVVMDIITHGIITVHTDTLPIAMGIIVTTAGMAEVNWPTTGDIDNHRLLSSLLSCNKQESKLNL
ncbi:MAG: hypothetical protein DRQ58_07815 [Gammaproteobacteria bacterium]|nr:MAG: hypothetical protein DRQ58_07815 [Gammaproteobacteria bacterium]